MMIAYRRWREGVVLLLSIVAAPVTSHAQSPAERHPECHCVLPPADPASPVGKVTALSGDVIITQDSGYTGPVAGAPVLQGSTIRVGLNSSVALQFKDICSVEAKAASTVSVQTIEEGVCVAVNETGSALVPANGASRIGMAVLGGLGLTGIGIAIGLGGGGGGDDKEPVSH